MFHNKYIITVKITARKYMITKRDFITAVIFMRSIVLFANV